MECIDPDKYHTLYKFKVPETWQNDINLIMEGKYSQISPKAKERIIEFHASNRNKPIGQVLYRCAARRQQMEKDLELEPGTLTEDSELLEIYTKEKDKKTKAKIAFNRRV